jgi:ATP-dependent Clp protease adapter protein ClpS
MLFTVLVCLASAQEEVSRTDRLLPRLLARAAGFQVGGPMLRGARAANLRAPVPAASNPAAAIYVPQVPSDLGPDDMTYGPAFCAALPDILADLDDAPQSTRAGDVRMQASERETKKSKGRTAVIERPKPKPKEVSKEDVKNDQPWRVLLHNDEVHTFDYCIGCIASTVPTVPRKKAHRIVMETHTSGMAVVTRTFKQQAKQYCIALQQLGLTSSIAPEYSGGDEPSPANE